jgi:hypothetical protein
MEGYLLIKIYLAAIQVGDSNRKITYDESIFIVLMTTSYLTHAWFIRSLQNDFFSVALGYLAILCLQQSKIFLCLIFYR